ncbi:CC-adding tRNA nucleotidyltransferase [Trichinella spiralis]|uniref:CC-adding tRNA nucleotidyltransferase n=1 Tax=Trichinella spiralis TaxID=6334 RepID=A0ABR3KIX2_TRISP
MVQQSGSRVCLTPTAMFGVIMLTFIATLSMAMLALYLLIGIKQGREKCGIKLLKKFVPENSTLSSSDPFQLTKVKTINEIGTNTSIADQTERSEMFCAQVVLNEEETSKEKSDDVQMFSLLAKDLDRIHFMLNGKQFYTEQSCEDKPTNVKLISLDLENMDEETARKILTMASCSKVIVQVPTVCSSLLSVDENLGKLCKREAEKIASFPFQSELMENSSTDEKAVQTSASDNNKPILTNSISIEAITRTENAATQVEEESVISKLTTTDNLPNVEDTDQAVVELGPTDDGDKEDSRTLDDMSKSIYGLLDECQFAKMPFNFAYSSVLDDQCKSTPNWNHSGKVLPDSGNKLDLNELKSVIPEADQHLLDIAGKLANKVQCPQADGSEQSDELKTGDILTLITLINRSANHPARIKQVDSSNDENNPLANTGDNWEDVLTKALKPDSTSSEVVELTEEHQRRLHFHRERFARQREELLALGIDVPPVQREQLLHLPHSKLHYKTIKFKLQIKRTVY